MSSFHRARCRLGLLLVCVGAGCSVGWTTRAAESPKPRPGGAVQETSTNRAPHFTVTAWEIHGNTLLPDNVVERVFAKYGGTNTVVGDIVKAGEEFQMEYRNRGYPTVSVSIPAQNITTNNGAVKILVFEGRLSDIQVVNNRHFSTENVLRSLPGLHTNMILNGPVFQAELDRANANQDRQIYPQIAPGPETNTTQLILQVKDRLPLHAKVELNDQSSPGTPDLRVNSSAAYNNLWQREHSLGVQYSFSPERFKNGDQWTLFDSPLVANYSAFYRLPLAPYDSVAEAVAGHPNTFGYDEATRSFRLPPPSGREELNIYGSRSTIDTGVNTLSHEEIYNLPGVRQIFREDVQQDITINESVGARLSLPIPQFAGFRSTLSFGLDYKNYELTSSKTNNFIFSEITVNENGTTNPPVISTVSSPVPTTRHAISYLPFSLHWDASRVDTNGFTTIGLGYSVNPRFAVSLFDPHKTRFPGVANSTRAGGDYHILTASLSREQVLFKNWRLALKLDGQWASEPLISNEQFGVGGLAGVRGYREGEVFGDAGWRVTAEQKTPPHVVGYINGKDPLTVRASVFMDYAEVYLLDPQGRDERTPLWGTGLGFVAGIGSRWEARMLFSWPLLNTLTTSARQPRFDFALSAQF